MCFQYDAAGSDSMFRSKSLGRSHSAALLSCSSSFSSSLSLRELKKQSKQRQQRQQQQRRRASAPPLPSRPRCSLLDGGDVKRDDDSKLVNYERGQTERLQPEGEKGGGGGGGGKKDEVAGAES
mmetsp:Transcript_31083/g.52599  ORF Transcript_31083/g.52599 Transcript_31083/m.52599 type:complete len:124 (+) Transcript_31083:618-989(+)